VVYQFGDFQLDCGRFELLRNGRALRVERKPMELLILLASREGQLVTRAEIAQRLWSSEVFVDTEHGINTAIRKLRHLLHDDPENPQFIQTVTGMGYRFIAPTVSIGEPAPDLPPAPTLEPAASDPVGAPEAPTPPPQELPKKPLAAKVAFVARFIALTVLFIVMAIGPRQIAGLLHRDPNPPITSLAVIPLDNLSGDPNQEYFADGMTDELITMLAKDSNLRVTSRTSVMQYKGAHKPLGEIARSLNVDGILEGSVSRTNNQVHMTLQLIRADTDSHLWAESYDRGNADVAGLPDDAAKAIAARLNSSAPPHAATRYVNPEAHDAYLQGHYFWMVGRNEEAGKEFQHAVEIQSDYAPGWAGLSEYYTVGSLDGDLDPLDVMPRAEDAARKAVDLDESLPQGHTVLAAAIFLNRWDGAEALKEVSRASELDPEYGEPYHLRAKILCALGRNEEAVAIQKQGTAVNPIEHPGAMAEIYLCTRMYDAAISDALLRLESFPAAADVLDDLANSYHWKGMDRQAAEMRAREFAAEGDPASAACVRRAFDSGGYRPAVRCEIAAFEKRARSHRVSAVGVARLHAILGERDETLALLDRALKQRDPLLIFWVQTDPAFDFLHSDPRYRAVVQRLGLPPAY
jgi:TolB-like protein/DNA-binding winged helix-turn-helix (wHTH) protein